MSPLRGKFSVPVRFAAVEADWRRRGFSCATFEDPPGRAWLDFVHDCDELIAVSEGRLQLTVEGAEAVLEPGDEVLIPRRCRHSVVNASDGRTVWLYGYEGSAA